VNLLTYCFLREWEAESEIEFTYYKNAKTEASVRNLRYSYEYAREVLLKSVIFETIENCIP